MLRTASVLALVSVAAALPARPTAPMRAPATNLALRGGNFPHLTTATAGVFLLQGSALSFAPQACTKAYGADMELSPVDQMMLEWGGSSFLGIGLFLASVHKGLSLPKALAVALAPTLGVCVRSVAHWTKTTSINAGALKAWSAITLAMVYLGWTEGAGVVDGGDLVKYWSYFMLLNILPVVFAFDKWADAYGVGGMTDRQRCISVNNFVFTQLSSALMLLFAGESIPKALAGVWAGGALLHANALIGQQWKLFRQPNGMASVFWLALSLAGTYSGLKMA